MHVVYHLTPDRPTETPIGAGSSAVRAEELRSAMAVRTGEPWTVVATFPPA